MILVGSTVTAQEPRRSGLVAFSESVITRAYALIRKHVGARTGRSARDIRRAREKLGYIPRIGYRDALAEAVGRHSRHGIGVRVIVAVVASLPFGWRVLTRPQFRRATVDPAWAQAGYELFHHEWTPGDSLSPEVRSPDKVSTYAAGRLTGEAGAQMEGVFARAASQKIVARQPVR